MALRESPLRDEHADRGATFTEFGGWDLPVAFDTIKTEHRAVRESAGIFDVSHMGEIEVSGPDATELVQRLTTNDVGSLAPGRAVYSAVTNEAGTMLDDTVVFRRPEPAEGEFLFVPNAGRDVEMHERWTAYRDEWGLEAIVENATDEYAMVALQGPEAEALLAAQTDRPVGELVRFQSTHASVAGVECLVSRTGYTGEDGFELLVGGDEAATVWSAFDCQPCGLGARDTLRLEAGLLLSGQDFDPEDEPRTPYEAGIGFVVALHTEFVGREALERANETGIEEKLVGVRVLDRGIPRHGYNIADTDGVVIGHVTSGTMSPTLDYPIGLGYVPLTHADPWTALDVVVRGQSKAARVEELPFYERDQQQ